MIVGTYNGWNIIALPSDQWPNVAPPSMLEFAPVDSVAVSTSPYTGQTQVYDWQNARWMGTINFAPMSAVSAAYWQAWLLEARAGLNVFQLGNPQFASPAGTGLGQPVVNGNFQAGFSVATRGWLPSMFGLLLPGDRIQIGYYLYRICSPVNSDANGDAVLSIWPNLRAQPGDSTPIQLANPMGLWRLAPNSKNKWTEHAANHGMSPVQIVEAI